MTFGQLSKYTSAMYAEMPPTEKEAWQARAEADKARYLHELAAYVPPPGYDAKGDAIVQHHKAGRKGGKNIRDVNAPKRNMSAYLLYQNAMREQFRAENPGMTFGQLAKYTSHMYRSLTPEEKATWEARAAQDKARYDAEMAAYVPPPGHDAQGNLMEDYKYGKKQKKVRTGEPCVFCFVSGTGRSEKRDWVHLFFVFIEQKPIFVHALSSQIIYICICPPCQSHRLRIRTHPSVLAGPSSFSPLTCAHKS